MRYMGKRLSGFAVMAVAALSAVSCVEDNFGMDEMSESILFTVEADSPVTRGSADSERLDQEQPCYLEPVKLTAGGEDTLYLHPSIRKTAACPNVGTRAAAVTTESIPEFIVRTYNSADEGHIYVNDVKVTRQGAVWKPASPVYWPNNALDFFAHHYGPAEGNASESISLSYDHQNHTISFNWTAPVSPDKLNDAKYQPDVIFAYKKASRESVTDNKVPLEFFHAFSEVKFKVGNVLDGIVETITVSDIHGEGLCTFNGNIPDKTDSQNPVSWVLSDQADKSYTQTFNVKVDNVEDSRTQQPVTDSTGPETTFMMLPQNLGGKMAQVEIVLNTDAGKKIVQGSINVDWEPGYTYTYIISTNSLIWNYVFEVIGSEQQEETDPTAGKFIDKAGVVTVNPTIVDGAYFKVLSYRYPLSDPTNKVPVPWSASASDGTTTLPEQATLAQEWIDRIQDMVIGPEMWLPRLNTFNKGNGSTVHEVKNITFLPQMIATNWQGDWDMRGRNDIGTSASPYDLSTLGGTVARSTANCYVVNAPGYYQFPLYYGNTVTGGVEIDTPYKNNSIDAGYVNENMYPRLATFVDYKGNNITQARIVGAVDAVLVWEDAYNLISDVKLNDTKDFVSFKVNRDNLQQGNALIAIRDAAGDIIWSWHIWISEYWTTEGSLQLGAGDVECETRETGYGKFTIAPYSLGWCDPKNEWYLQRSGMMTFVQAESGNTDQLKLLQREDLIEYWIGNNVYYQFGRKDPFVGFRGTSSIVKYNFGKYPYKLEPQKKTIAEGIRNPNVMYVGAAEQVQNNDWTSTSYYNLWNNTSIGQSGRDPHNPDSKYSSDDSAMEAYHYSGVKTVYDPCPAGYMVPPVGFFRTFTHRVLSQKDLSDSEIDDNSDFFNGKCIPYGSQGIVKYYKWIAYPELSGTGNEIGFTMTGHRWYGNSVYAAGSNFNPQVVYLWSNQIRFKTADYCAFSLALGWVGASEIAGKNQFAISYRFEGRRAMARPVRPVKEFKR